MHVSVITLPSIVYNFLKSHLEHQMEIFRIQFLPEGEYILNTSAKKIETLEYKSRNKTSLMGGETYGNLSGERPLV